MNVLNPSIWYLIAIGLGLVGAIATVVFFRGDSPDWIALVIALGGLGAAFGLLLALPKAPSPVLTIVTYVVGVLLLGDVVRKAAKRRPQRPTRFV